MFDFGFQGLGGYRGSIKAALALDFTTTLSPLIDFTRSTSGTYYDGDTYVKAEENLLVNSATLSTQSVAVTANSYTLSFYNTGTVTLSGAYSGSLVGTGASDRVTLTFTPTAGTLTLTVSGTVEKGQLEQRDSGINLLNYSSEFNNALWVKGASTTLTPDVAQAPDGTFTADRLQLPATGGTYIEQSISVTSDDKTLSVYAKAVSGTSSFYLTYNGSILSTLKTVTDSEWTLVEYAVGGGASKIGISNGGDTFATDIYIWKAELYKEGTQVTAYTPTTTTPITRYQPQLLTAGVNQARLDHSPVAQGETKVPLGLLVEEARTNLIPYSEDFGHSSWSKNNITVTSNIAIAPDGTLSMDKITPIAGVNVSGPAVYMLLSTTAEVRTLSTYAKASEYDTIFLRVGGSLSTPIGIFSLSNGTLLSSQNIISYTIDNCGNGTYKLSITYNNSASAFAPNIGACSSTYSISNGNVLTTTNGTSGIYIWGAQLEVGAFPTSYIKTTGAAATRTADNASISGTNFSSWYNQSEGTIVTEAKSKVTSGAAAIALFSDFSNSDDISLQINNNVSMATCHANSITQVNVNGTQTYGYDTFGTHCVGYKNNDLRSVFQTDNLLDTFCTMPSNLIRLDIGKLWWSGLYLNGHIKSLTYYNKRLKDAKLVELSGGN